MSTSPLIKSIQETVVKDYLSDLKYIANEQIALLPNGEFCKFSKILKDVTAYDLTEERYLTYWKNLYHTKPKDMQEGIMQACIDKLHNGCITCNEMISLVENSNCTGKEKTKILDLLTGKCKTKSIIKESEDDEDENSDL